MGRSKRRADYFPLNSSEYAGIFINPEVPVEGMNRAKQLRLKDDILEATLETYAANPVLNQKLILQGGGALHFIYSGARYSSDLDFVCPTLDTDAAEIIGEMRKGVVMGNQIVPAIIKTPDRTNFLRAAYPLGEQQHTGKVEILHQVAFDYGQTEGKYAPLLVESPSEIYADKITATLSRMARRNSIKSTDLFDLEFLMNNLSVTCPLPDVMRKAESYNEEDVVTTENVNRVISHITNPDNHDRFRTDLEKTLMPDVYRSLTLDAKYFHRCADHFGQYRPLISELTPAAK